MSEEKSNQYSGKTEDKDSLNNSWTDFLELMERKLIETYGQVVVDHARNPRNNKPLQDANGYTSHTGPCGDTIEIWIKVNAGVLEDVAFRSDGCEITQATGSMVTELAKGKKLDEAKRITPEQIIEALIKLPDDHQHCALLARDALNKAIKNYLENLTE